jgi:malonyl-CoA/methylmalonyl-CoA synthetase
MNANLYALLRAHFPESAEQPCLQIPDGSVIHYGDLDAASARMAHALLAAGCQPGDRVAAQVDKCWEACAVSRRRRPRVPSAQHRYQKGSSRTFRRREPVIVCQAESVNVSRLRPEARVLTLASAAGTLLERAERESGTFETVLSQADDLAALVYTSGTTGRPKGAMLTHRNLGSNALALTDCWGFTRGDVLLHALPIYHVHGLFVACHCALVRIPPSARFVAGEVRAAAARAAMGADVHTGFARRNSARPIAARCSLFWLAPAPRPAIPRTGCTLLERYGMSETGMNTSNPLAGERIAGTVGPPLPGVAVRVVDAEGRPCPAGEVGSIEVKGQNVFAGYWRMPDKTREEFTADGFFRTGDVGELLPDGYLRIVGRAKDLIITGGLNVYPKEIEERIDALPGVVESAVIGLPDADFGEAVVAIVVAKPDHTLTEGGVVAALKGEIANFKVPKRVADLPRNAMGKVQKNLLRDRFGSAA